MIPLDGNMSVCFPYERDFVQLMSMACVDQAGNNDAEVK
jgi:hypothetical protein